ncbi:MAG: pyruvate kinase [Proteobacteria bacterium]|nr:pyruvate kinase [Pseudomonadota bacterium]
MRRNRNIKIVATLGPASSDAERIGVLFDQGVDVFRLNFSHGTHDEHRRRYDIIRALEKEKGRPIGTIADLQGPKLRVGNFADGRVLLRTGSRFRLDLDDAPGTESRVQLPHPEIFNAVEPGTDLLIDDGRLRLEVLEAGPDFAETRVRVGGDLSNHKGVNVPSAILDLSPITNKDERDLDFALRLGIDWIALSFVQRPEDVARARRMVAGRAGVLVKLEKPSAIETLEEIIELADALMVARGDLGVEMPPEDVPGIQKRIIRSCRRAGKPVIVATQMLDSMVHSPTPTRAEASDVATAVYDGADAVMLSAETAVGDYPVESVSMMNRIITRVEKDPLYRSLITAEGHQPEATAADAITAAASASAATIGAACIATFTSTGSTTLRAARERPSVPILGLTTMPNVARRLTLVWGVHAVDSEDVKNFGEMVAKAVAAALAEGFAVTGDRIIITAGVPFGTPGATNILRIAWAE